MLCVRLVIKPKKHVEPLFSYPLKPLFSMISSECLILLKLYQSSFTKYDCKNSLGIQHRMLNTELYPSPRFRTQQVAKDDTKLSS